MSKVDELARSPSISSLVAVPRASDAQAICALDAIRSIDLPQVARLFSEPAVRLFLGGALSPDDAEQRASELLALSEPAKVWAIRLSLSVPTSLLGVVVLDRHHDLEDFEVSYLLLPEHWGRGYATAAVRQVLAYAFDVAGHRRVLAETQTANTTSIRLLERLGFRHLRQVMRFGAEQSIYVFDEHPSKQRSTYGLAAM